MEGLFVGGGMFLIIVYLIIGFTLFVGWIKNIIKLVKGSKEVNGGFILRIIGIFFAPLGGILGYMNI